MEPNKSQIKRSSTESQMIEAGIEVKDGMIRQSDIKAAVEVIEKRQFVLVGSDGRGAIVFGPFTTSRAASKAMKDAGAEGLEPVEIMTPKNLKTYYADDEVLSRESGLPEPLSADADKVIEILLDSLDRAGQDYERHHVKVYDDGKNEEDTWGGTAKGTVKNLWNFLTKECGLSPSVIVKAINDSLKGEGIGTVYE